MTPALSQIITSPSQAWKLIEQDYTLRHSLVASEWSTEYLRAWNAVFAEGRKRNNAGYFGAALIEMEIADADKRAEWAVSTCYEIWHIQGREKCRPLFRAIFECCLEPMFSIRQGCFRHQLEIHGKRTREISQGNSAVLGDMKREMDELQAKWNTKLEIATRENQQFQAQHDDLLRLPEGLRSSGDPVVGNPYGVQDPRHTVWTDATARAAQELHAFNAASVGYLNELYSNNPDDARRVLLAHWKHILIGKFDIWAKRGVHVVWCEADERQFVEWLERYANVWLKEVKQFFPLELGNIDWLLGGLRMCLIARIEYWKSEAQRYLIQQAGDGVASVPQYPPAEPTVRASSEQQRGVTVSADFRSVVFKGKCQALTLAQSQMMRILWEAHQSGHPSVGKERLLAAIERETSQVRDTWRGSDLWQTLIVMAKKGVYELKLPSAKPSSTLP